MIFFYNISIALYVLAVRIASIWNGKARLWLQGRKNLWKELQNSITPSDRVIWIHCSSAGEFEQGKPVIEQLKIQYPAHKILVSFFSPSGYAVAGKYSFADAICYIPVDTNKNARRFFDLVHPELVIFVKYEYWYHHLKTAADRNIPLLLISATFRKDQVFFKSYGGFYRRILFLFQHLFVQDQYSEAILRANGIQHCSISGDSRFDRVKEIAAHFTPIEPITIFADNKPLLVAGSTWPDDEQMLAEVFDKKDLIKLVIAPHEINEEHIRSIVKLFPKAVKYSEILQNEASGGNNPTGKITKPQLKEKNILIIDNVGMLSRLYYYSIISYIGGGFTKDGIHNTLEAAVYSKPVLFGPNFQKYREAKELIACGGGFSVPNAQALEVKLDEFFNNPEYLERTGNSAGKYINDHIGATGKILNYIQANLLLTR